MPWLLLDTALPRAVVAVVAVDGTVCSEVLLDETRRHAERLTDAVDEALDAAGITVNDLVGIGVGTGPGSFIGVRTGLSFARGLGAALGIDVVGIDDLVALYCSIEPALDVGAVVVVDARRGERYVGHVEVVAGHAVLRGAAQAVANAEATAGHVEVTAIGAVDELQWPQGQRLLPLPGPSARGLWGSLQSTLAAQTGHDGQRSPVAPLPVYVRGADAKLPTIDPAARRSAVLASLDALDALDVPDSNDAATGPGGQG